VLCVEEMIVRQTAGQQEITSSMNRPLTSELIAQLQSGETTSRQLVENSLRRISELNGVLNAFVSIDADGALAKADEIDQRRQAGKPVGRLAGLPVAVKDNMCTIGLPTSCGSRMLKDFRAPYDAHVVQRIQAEDGVMIGKLNQDEFAMGSSTETSIYGPTRNPWNADYTAGGSSGGSAVAVASGMVPLALGSDTGGSIRQPASFCGVVGMKPTYGRVSRYGLVAFASSLDQIGPLAGDAWGATLLLECIAGHDKRDSTSLNVERPDWLSQLDSSLKGLRIGIADEYFVEGLDAEVEQSVREAIRVFEAAGAEVVPVSLPHSKYAVATYYLVACSEASSNLARYDGIHYGHRAEKFSDLVDLYSQSRGEGFGTEVKRRIMLGTYALSAGYYDAYYLKALKVRRRIREDFDKAFASVDVIAGPVSPTAAFRLGEKLDDPLAMYLNDIYTISTNLAGLPGISIPCGLTKDKAADRPATSGACFGRSPTAAVRSSIPASNSVASRTAVVCCFCLHCRRAAGRQPSELSIESQIDYRGHGEHRGSTGV
jgi:aspartyl-tRNA(Asn)/glutamyl-tRNA(Gln) amidotransferase subunit A